MQTCLTIVKKELLEFFRDKVSVLAIILPVIVLPMIVCLFNTLTTTHNIVNIGVICQNENDKEIISQFFGINEQYRLDFSGSDLKGKLKNNNFVVEKSGNNIIFYYNSSSYKSVLAATSCKSTIEKIYTESILEQNKDHFLNFSLLDENNKQTSEETNAINLFLPLIVMMFIFQNAANFASTTFSGERERGTLEMLILTNAKREHIYIGKCLSMITISIISSMVTLLSLYVSSNILPDSESFVFLGSPKNAFLLVLFIFFLSALFVFASTLVSIFSPSVRSSQLINQLIVMVSMSVPALISFGVLNIESPVLKSIPYFSLVISFFNIILGKTSALYTVIALLETAVLIVIMIYASRSLLKKEKIIR